MDSFILFNDQNGIEMNCFITLNGKLHLTISDPQIQLNSGSITLDKNDTAALIAFLRKIKKHIVNDPSGSSTEESPEENTFIENYINESENVKLKNLMDYSFMNLFLRNN